MNIVLCPNSKFWYIQACPEIPLKASFPPAIQKQEMQFEFEQSNGLVLNFKVVIFWSLWEKDNDHNFFFL